MIRVRNLSKSFGKNAVLKGVDLDLESGRSLAVIGRSGGGKSVLLRSILGLYIPEKGSVTSRPSPESPWQEKIDLSQFGMLFQHSALFDSLTIWENVAFQFLHGKNRLKRGEARDLAIEKLEKTGLSSVVADAYPAEISGGMQKRAALARAIASNPRLLFFDEPTSGLDPITAGVISQLIRTIVTDLGASAITITHDLISVETVADDVAMLEGGKIVWTGPVREIHKTDNPYMRQFLRGEQNGPICILPGEH